MNNNTKPNGRPPATFTVQLIPVSEFPFVNPIPP